MQLELRGITKRFGSFTANDQISITVEPGQIHSLLGENGAGKSTLMNCLFGLLRPDEGEILIDGVATKFSNSGEAVRRGIGMVHQHFMLVPVFSVTENVVLGFEPTKSLNRIDYKRATDDIRRISKEYNLEVDPDAIVENLPVGLQQRVEILKALSHDAELLILDEPTAVLTPQETTEIFAVLRRLKDEGHSIIFISHKLYEVLEIADRITVIRRGRVVGERLPSQTDEDDLAVLMVGREVQLTVDRGESHPAEVALSVEHLSVKNDRGRETVQDLTFEVRKGEIFGIAGVAGNGQDELVESLTGLRRPAGGRILLDGVDVTHEGARELHGRGVSYVPADRHRFGLVLSFPLTDNLVLTDYYAAPYARGPIRDDAAIRARAVEAIEQFDVRTPSPDVAAGTLSGGNQQKLIVAREFGRELRLLVLDQPTRGLDVGSVEFIHRQAIKKRDAGTAVLLVSAELDEVLELSDRIGVIYRGRLVAVLDGRTADREQVGLLMATGGREARPTPSGDPHEGVA